MARSYVLGGVSATGLATGKPYIRRITRTSGAPGATRADGLTCTVISSGDHAGKLSFCTSGSGVTGTAATDGKGKDWDAGSDGTGGELLFVEFPSTTRTLSVQLEHAETVADNSNGAADGSIRLKVMLTAPGQVVTQLDANGIATTNTDTMAPVANGNFIEIGPGDTATINARTKGVFILIQKYASTSMFRDSNGATSGVVVGATIGAGPTDATNACAILVTAVLDHEGFQGGNGVETGRIDAAGAVTSSQRKIWPLNTNGSDGIG